MSDDDIFWERISEMPFSEAEQECVIRREHNVLEIAMLQGEIEKIKSRTGLKANGSKECRDIGVVLMGVMGQNTLLNERIKYLRRVQDKINWKEAVRALYGDDAVEDCKLWIEQNIQPATSLVDHEIRQAG